MSNICSYLARLYRASSFVCLCNVRYQSSHLDCFGQLVPVPRPNQPPYKSRFTLSTGPQRGELSSSFRHNPGGASRTSSFALFHVHPRSCLYYKFQIMGTYHTLGNSMVQVVYALWISFTILLGLCEPHIVQFRSQFIGLYPTDEYIHIYVLGHSEASAARGRHGCYTPRAHSKFPRGAQIPGMPLTGRQGQQTRILNYCLLLNRHMLNSMNMSTDSLAKICITVSI